MPAGFRIPILAWLTIRSVNVEPQAIAGEDQMVTADKTVTLDGSLSADVDGAIVSYHWVQTQGTPVQLSDASAAVVSFEAVDSPDGNAVLVFELTVTDDQGLKGMDTCRVQVIPGNSEGGYHTPQNSYP